MFNFKIDFPAQQLVFPRFKTFGPGQDVKRYPKGVRLDNRKVLSASGPRTKYFERFFSLNKQYYNCFYI